MSKKLLIREVFEKGKKESGRESKSGVALFLSLYFYDEWKFEISERTFVRYYDAFLIDHEDKNIDTQVLDKMSQYLEFKHYKDFCKTETFTKMNRDSSRTSVKVRIDDDDDSDKKYPNITVNITTNPILKLQEFFAKQSGFGWVGLLIFGGLIADHYLKKEESPVAKLAQMTDSVSKDRMTLQENVTSSDIRIIPVEEVISVKKNDAEEKKENYMYWNGEHFVATDEASLGSYREVIPMDDEKLRFFRKITRPDTITEKSLSKVWYSKHKNIVEFFTADGENPENGKELMHLTKHMLETHILSK